jgi:hypothetical protein
MNGTLRAVGSPLMRPALASGIVLLAAAAPWALGFSQSHAAVANAVAFAMAFGPLTLLIAELPPAAEVSAAGGLWLAGSPWLLGYGNVGTAAWAADLVLGAALTAVSYRAARATASAARAESGLTVSSAHAEGVSRDSAPRAA